ncbi:MAG: choice-of-anchor D domain-containing protein [Candidatus Acidiferrum sp.]
MRSGWFQYDSDSATSVVPIQHNAPTSQGFLRILFGGLFLVVLLALHVSPVVASEGKLTLSPSALEFGNVGVGSSHALSLKIGNAGNANIIFSQEFIKGSGFTLIGFHLPLTLSPGHDLSVIVKFAPTKLGGFSGEIHFASDAHDGSATLALAGKGIAKSSALLNSGLLSATPGNASFTKVPIGTSNTQSITLKNVGTAKATITGFNASGNTFTVKGLTVPLTIPVGDTTTFEVVFSPAQSEQYTGQVTVDVYTSQKKLAIPLTGSGSANSRLISVSPTVLNFGSVNIGAQTTAKVQLQNGGNSSIDISQVTLSGTGFSATGIASGLKIAPGQSALLTVEFSPTTAGAKSGTVAIASNASNPTTIIPLSGSGISASTRTVQLNWLASSSSSVVGYNVYRSNSSSASFAKLDSTVISGLAFTDSTVQAGQTYLYEVTAVASDGVESAPCSPVTASVP